MLQGTKWYLTGTVIDVRKQMPHGLFNRKYFLSSFINQVSNDKKVLSIIVYNG
jgi:hypothetical protein